MVEAAGRIVQKAGIGALSMAELSRELGRQRFELAPYINKDEDILILLLHSLEDEITQRVSDVVAKSQSPKDKLQNIFETLYDLFGQKPYYLSIIFSTELVEKYSAVQKILVRIKSIAKIHLVNIINDGRKEEHFITNRSTKNLINNIIGSFRSFMNEQWVIDKMVREIELLKDVRD